MVPTVLIRNDAKGESWGVVPRGRRRRRRHDKITEGLRHGNQSGRVRSEGSGSLRMGRWAWLLAYWPNQREEPKKVTGVAAPRTAGK